MLSFELTLPKKISANVIYGGQHWSKRKQLKDLFLWSFLDQMRNLPEIKSVNFRYHFFLKGKMLDCTNCFYMVKIIEDCLRHYGKLVDDTPEFVKSVLITSSKGSVNKVLIEVD